ncbi:hypothetical protein RI129_003077, partial [Pyrocoelia pectoralis]
MSVKPKINILSNILLPRFKSEIAVLGDTDLENIEPTTSHYSEAVPCNLLPTTPEHCYKREQEVYSLSSPKRIKRNSILLCSINETRVVNLAQRKKTFYTINKSQKRTIGQLKVALKRSKNKIKHAYEYSKCEMFRDLEAKLDPHAPLKSAFQNRLLTGAIINVGYKDPLIFLKNCYDIFAQQVALMLKRSVLKVNLVLVSNFINRQNLEIDQKTFATKNEVISVATNLKEWYLDN